MSIDSTELNQTFKNFINEINNDDDLIQKSKHDLELDTYLLYVNAEENSHFVFESGVMKTFDSHQTAKESASILARIEPYNKISILRVVENVGFMPYN